MEAGIVPASATSVEVLKKGKLPLKDQLQQPQMRAADCRTLDDPHAASAQQAASAAPFVGRWHDRRPRDGQWGCRYAAPTLPNVILSDKPPGHGCFRRLLTRGHLLTKSRIHKSSAPACAWTRIEGGARRKTETSRQAKRYRQ